MNPSCPRDGWTLVSLRHEGASYRGCEQCRGLLLPIAMIGELAALMNKISLKTATWPRADIVCPQCGQAMCRAHHEGVEIDLCIHCQVVWLDRGEIDAIRVRQPEDETQAQARAAAENQALETGADVLRGADSGLLDWLGDALGALLSP
jgi:Zn-finger nucleic acid-binding protein